MQTSGRSETLQRAFYLRDANTVAPELLGKLLVHRSPQGVTAGMIVEVEAYMGAEDKGAHSYQNRRTARTQIQFGPGGYAYVYSIYGMHFCFNVVTNVSEKPEVVFIRALRPVAGEGLMRRRRKTAGSLSELCNGPGKLCQAMGITKEQYGCDLCGSELRIQSFRPISDRDILVSPRINIDYADECKDHLWRYFIRDEPCVSKVAARYLRQTRAWK